MNHDVMKFQRGDRVKVRTDSKPKPEYIVVTHNGQGVQVSQIGSGFMRTVPLSELQHPLTAE